jgi:tRNA threonylcarbamoyladenosine biosynthesis protein TsaE
MSQKSIELRDLAATEELGRRLGQLLAPGAIIGLVGTLGAGKTHLTRAIAEGLGVYNTAAVNSPTFVLIQEYAGPIPLYHFDTYRLSSSREFLELGSEEYLYGDGVCVLEWADKVQDVLPKDCLTLQIQILSETARRIEFTATGPASKELLAKLFPES